MSPARYSFHFANIQNFVGEGKGLDIELLMLNLLANGDTKLH